MGKRASDTGPKTAWDVLWVVLSNPKVITVLIVLAGGSTALHSDTVRQAINWNETETLPETPGEFTPEEGAKFAKDQAKAQEDFIKAQENSTKQLKKKC